MPGYKIKVPASTANLGSGFDTIGIALNIYNTLVINVSTEVSDDPRLFITASGKYSEYTTSEPIKTNKDNLVYKVFVETMEKLGKKIPKSVFMEFDLDIPVSRGLGSSTTAIIMGLFAAFAAANVQPDIGYCLQVLLQKEGHLDNGAPSLLGGIKISWTNNGQPYVRDQPIFRIGNPEEAITDENPTLFETKLIIPKFEASTKEARTKLQPTILLEDGVFNISRTSLLLNLFVSQGFSNDDLMMALDDRIHQKQRKAIYGKSWDLMLKLREAGYPTCISGAGPTLLIMLNKNTLKPNSSIEEIIGGDEDFIVQDVNISPYGVQVEGVS